MGNFGDFGNMGGFGEDFKSFDIAFPESNAM